jgi:hypothetical protein
VRCIGRHNVCTILICVPGGVAGVRPGGPPKAEPGALRPGPAGAAGAATAASLWLGAGADPKVVQRVLGHPIAAMTMDLCGHMVDANLWQAAQLVGGISGASGPSERGIRTDSEPGKDTRNL